MHTVTILKHLVENNWLLTYLLIFLFTIVEGEIVAISAGILILLGALNFWLCLIAIFCGGMVKTVFGYFVGGFLYKKFNHSKFFKYVEKKVLRIMPHFDKKPFWSIFVSKFIIGVNHLVILFSGYQKVDFKVYMTAEFASTLIWAPFMLSVGYFFSYAALQVSKEISKFLLIIILFIIGFYLLGKVITFLYDIFENLKENNENK